MSDQKAVGVYFIEEFGTNSFVRFDDLEQADDFDNLAEEGDSGELVELKGQQWEVVNIGELSDTEGYDQPWDKLSSDAQTVVELYLEELAAEAKDHANSVDRHIYGGR